MTDEPNKKILQSYVFFEDKAFFVSTIERTFEVYGGSVRGLETLVWEWDADTRERGDLVHQAGGLSDHEEICRSVIKTGEMPQEAGQ